MVAYFSFCQGFVFREKVGKLVHLPLSKSEQGFIAACNLLTFNYTYRLRQFQKELTDSDRSSNYS